MTGELHHRSRRRPRTPPRVGRTDPQCSAPVLENLSIEVVDMLETVCGALRIKAQSWAGLLVLIQCTVVSIQSWSPWPSIHEGGGMQKEKPPLLTFCLPLGQTWKVLGVIFTGRHDVRVPQDTKCHQPGREQSSPSVKMGVKRWSKKTARKEREKKTGQGTILTHADVSFWFW